jgi:hypothetical protein
MKVREFQWCFASGNLFGVFVVIVLGTLRPISTPSVRSIPNYDWGSSPVATQWSHAGVKFVRAAAS